MDAQLERAIAAQLGRQVVASTPVSGGDINRAFQVTLADGARVFVKTHGSPPAGMFGCEAAGLAWLAEAGAALRLPRVLGVSDGDAQTPAFLLLEWIERGPPAADHDARLGQGLAELHRTTPTRFGLEYDNWIATLPQDNRACADWPTFYGQRRLQPQLERARRGGIVDRALGRGLERVLSRLPGMCGADEPPARLHGDLWGGNALSDAHGAPVLIDPAAYGGHREIDLAMMRLFGGFGPRVFEAYAAAHPLAPGAHERIALYQLYPVLVHVNLFGAGYLGQLRSLLSRLP